MSGAKRGPPAEVGRSGSEREAILRERARELARVREVRPVASSPILPFSLGGERYGVEAAAVHQILDAAAVSPLLGAPREVIGAVVLRTRVVPVLDLRVALGLEAGGLSDLRRVVVLDDAGDLFGIAVEQVAARADVPDPERTAAEGPPFKWIAPGRVGILDPSRLGLVAGKAP